MSDHRKLSRQEWIDRCALEIGVLIPLHLHDYVEEFSPALVVDWAGAIWADTQGSEVPEEAAWHAIDEVRNVKALG
ncbi:MAG TPA: hypothetical protein H9903_12650 [Candidatus Aquabacterium excrementipullorum]|nr:hypothetical protein [Candidatus Aquabacterium excrementipullorum]